jgi:hypothetical protein
MEIEEHNVEIEKHPQLNEEQMPNNNNNQYFLFRYFRTFF